jgi:hypothetical protein
MWREVWIEGADLVIQCPPEELEQFHLGDLKQDVRNSNRAYREHLLGLARQEAKTIEREAGEKNVLDDLA